MAGFVLFWIVLSVLVAVYAGKKGRSGVGFFLLSFLASPLIGLLVALLVEPRREIPERKSGMKKCPDCAEYVREDARVCRFCRHEFQAETPERGTTTERAAPTVADFDAWSKEAVAEPTTRQEASTEWGTGERAVGASEPGWGRRHMRALVPLASAVALAALGSVFLWPLRRRPKMSLGEQAEHKTQVHEGHLEHHLMGTVGREKDAQSSATELLGGLPYPSSTRFQSVVATPDGWVCLAFATKDPDGLPDQGKVVYAPAPHYGEYVWSKRSGVSPGFESMWKAHCTSKWSLRDMVARLNVYARKRPAVQRAVPLPETPRGRP